MITMHKQLNARQDQFGQKTYIILKKSRNNSHKMHVVN